MQKFSIPKVTVYVSENCPRCNILKNWLKKQSIPFVEKDLTDLDIMTDLIIRDIVVLSAPALELKHSTCNQILFSNQIFNPDNSLNLQVLTKFLGVN